MGFLNSVESVDVIQAVVDINPQRWHKYIPGSGHQIVPPASLKSLNPGVIIVTNPLYQQEIEAQASQLNVQADFLVLQ